MECVSQCDLHYDKNDVLLMQKTKTQISCAVSVVTAQLIRVFAFAEWIVQTLSFLNVQFQVSILILLLYRPVCVGPGWKSWRPFFLLCGFNMSRIVRKPDFCLGENKGADQLRGNREADQRLCFRYSDSTIPLLLKSEISSF